MSGLEVLAGGAPEDAIDPKRVSRNLAYEAEVPPRFVDCRLEGFEPRRGTQRALAAARRVAGDRAHDRGLILSGLPGTGKTHLAVGVLAARCATWLRTFPQAVINTPEGGVLVRPDLEQRFVVVPTLLDRLRAGVEYRDRPDPLPALMRAELVVLDDLGREKSTDWVIERLYVLVNERYNQRRPTIVTTNYTPGELNDRGYDALMSRLTEAADIVRIEASDYRGARA